MRSFSIAMCLNLLGIAGCGDPGSRQGITIEVLASGHRTDFPGESFWIDLAVARPQGLEEEVGIVWRLVDSARTSSALATYQEVRRDGRELWQVEVPDFALSPGKEVEYDAYVTVGDKTVWSAFGPHYIYAPVWPTHPVRLLSSALSLLPDDTPQLTGRARTLNRKGEEHLYIDYSLDEGLTTSTAEATRDGADYAFAVPLVAATPATERVAFTVRLSRDGTDAGDDRGGSKYSHQLAVQLEEATFVEGSNAVSTGIRVLSGSFRTDLPIQGVSIQIDDGLSSDLPDDRLTEGCDGFSTTPGRFCAVFSTAGFTEGAHTATIEAKAGIFVVRAAPLEFTVHGGIRCSNSSLTLDESLGMESDFALDSAANIYVLQDSPVRYGGFGTTQPALVYAEEPSGISMDSIAIDGSGRVYATDGRRLVRWRTDGAVDTAFATNGVLTLESPNAFAVCWATDIAVEDQEIYVSDSCNARVLQLSLEGALLASADLGNGDDTLAGELAVSSGSVWVELTTYEAGVSATALARLAFAGGSGLAVETVQLPLETAYPLAPAGFAVVTGGFWLLDSRARLHLLDADGTLRATWTGGDTLVDREGALYSASAVQQLADGSVAVLSGGHDTIRVFSEERGR